MPAPAKGSRAVLYLAIAAVVALIAVVAVLLIPKTGALVVTVAGPGNKPVDALQIYVDDQKRCEQSPCKVADLPKGSHFIRVTAAGYQPTAAQAVKIVPGEETPFNVPLTHASEGTGIRVSAEGTGLKLLVDGKEIGPLPQELKDMTPGEHKVVVTGIDPKRYDKWEKTVTVESDKMVEVEPKVKVLEGLVTITAGDNADDAKVVLVSGKERRPIPRLPIKVTISPDKQYSIVASKKGFNDYNETISFEDGQGEKTYAVSLTAIGEAPAVAPPVGGGTHPKPGGGGVAVPPTPKAPPAAAGEAHLNINSIPVSNVILDGRPLGPTPKVGVSVKAGAHTIMFVHAEFGRKTKSVNVASGATSTVAVRFP
jgi:serine/threonine-protein kinase